MTYYPVPTSGPDWSGIANVVTAASGLVNAFKGNNRQAPAQNRTLSVSPSSDVGAAFNQTRLALANQSPTIEGRTRKAARIPFLNYYTKQLARHDYESKLFKGNLSDSMQEFGGIPKSVIPVSGRWTEVLSNRELASLGDPTSAALPKWRQYI